MRVLKVFYLTHNKLNVMIILINRGKNMWTAYSEKKVIMGIEKRKSRRTDVSVVISLRQLGDNYVSGISGKKVDVNVINISKHGIAFKSDYEFKLNTYYDTYITLANKESFETIIEIIRMENLGETETTYGCRFVGINSEDQFKIEVYQLLYESNLNHE